MRRLVETRVALNAEDCLANVGIAPRAILLHRGRCRLQLQHRQVLGLNGVGASLVDIAGDRHAGVRQINGGVESLLSELVVIPSSQLHGSARGIRQEVARPRLDGLLDWISADVLTRIDRGEGVDPRVEHEGGARGVLAAVERRRDVADGETVDLLAGDEHARHERVLDLPVLQEAHRGLG